MARAYDACMIDLTASGMEQEKAKRACSAAFWAEHGMFPAEADASGFDPDGSCAAFAHQSIAELAAGVVAPGLLVPMGALKEVAELGAYDGFTPAEPTPKRLLREVQMLAPGTLIDATGKEFTWVDADMFHYAANFDPTDQPTILEDHVKSARTTLGRIRALRVDTKGAQPVLMGLWEFLGQENVEKVLDTRYSRTSGRFMQGKDPDQKVVIEGSVVWRGAYDRGYRDRAQILGPERGKQTMAMSVPNAALAAPAPTPAPITPPPEATLATTADPDPSAHAASPQGPSAILGVPAGDAAAVVADLQARLASVEAERAQERVERAQERATAQLQRSADQVFDLVKLGKSAPDWHEQELAVLHGMPEALRPKYLDLRKKLPNVWPAGGRESVVLASAPGGRGAEDAELKEYAELGAGMGFAPAAATKGGASNV